jgi:TRAP-type C4-dicarboxylate transport system permease small subunit
MSRGSRGDGDESGGPKARADGRETAAGSTSAGRAPAGSATVGPDAQGTGFFNLLGQVELRFAQVCVVIMTLLVLTSAVARTAGNPVSWTVDLATFSFAWAVFVGADVALRRDKLVSIDLLVDRFSERARAWVQLGNSLIIVVFLIALVVLGFRLSYTTSERSFSGLPWLSYTWVTISVPVGAMLMLYTMSHKMRDLVRYLKGPPQ